MWFTPFRVVEARSWAQENVDVHIHDIVSPSRLADASLIYLAERFSSGTQQPGGGEFFVRVVGGLFVMRFMGELAVMA